MGETRRLSFAAAAVLLAASHGHQYGFDIIGATGLPAGTVYPVLRRLEDAGYFRSQWEDAGVAQREQRPARKYYELTQAGRTGLEAAVARFPLLQRGARRRGRATKLRPA